MEIGMLISQIDEQSQKIADSTVGLDGTGLDFGVFVVKDSNSVLGTSFSETEGVAIPQVVEEH